MDVAPGVVENTQTSILELCGKFWIIELETSKFHACGGFYDGLSRTAQKYIHFPAVPCAKLLASHNTFTILTVTEKHAALNWPQEDTTVCTIINSDGSRVVENIDITVLTFLYDKLLACNFIWQPSYGFIFEAIKHVVLWVHLLVVNGQYLVFVWLDSGLRADVHRTDLLQKF